MEMPKYAETDEVASVAAILMAGMLASREKPSQRLAKEAVEAALLLFSEVYRLGPAKYGE
jgi:hypothetical protein